VNKRAEAVLPPPQIRPDRIGAVNRIPRRRAGTVTSAIVIKRGILGGTAANQSLSLETRDKLK